MRLSGLGVIRQAVLELGPGLTAVTGETGAGKTMVVTGLGLLMGSRADTGRVREGAGSASVEGRVRVAADQQAARRAREAGAELDEDGTLIISRTVGAEGRSRAYLGGRSAPVGVLAEVAEHLVTVHGQSDQLRLRTAAAQRDALDRFAGARLVAPLATYQQAWGRLRAIEDEVDRLRAQARERAQEAELLRIGLTQVEQVAPQPGEDHRLREEALRLGHAEELRQAASGAQEVLTGGSDPTAGSDVASLVSVARRLLEAAREHDPALGALADRLAEAGYLLADVAGDCASYVAGVEAEPARLAAVEDRRAELGALVRAHGPDVDAVLTWAQDAGRRLLELDGDEDRVEGLLAEADQQRAEAAAAATELSRQRTAAGRRLAAAVTAELAELAMPDAQLLVQVSQRELGGGTGDRGLPCDLGSGPRAYQAGPSGVDEVELLLIAHPGAPARPVARGASGGELSRIMLGIEVVLGAVDPVPTFVFDEVDAGVGGRAALGIGRRLATLARTSQVIVVTHLPQVAAFADRQLVVAKSTDGQVTESGVRAVEGEERVQELARMLGGVADSAAAREHARELLAEAAAHRQAGQRRRRGAPRGIIAR